MANKPAERTSRGHDVSRASCCTLHHFSRLSSEHRVKRPSSRPRPRQTSAMPQGLILGPRGLTRAPVLHSTACCAFRAHRAQMCVPGNDATPAIDTVSVAFHDCAISPLSRHARASGLICVDPEPPNRCAEDLPTFLLARRAGGGALNRFNAGSHPNAAESAGRHHGPH